MKIQNRQGYCLLLGIEESDYSKATLRAVFYERDIDGFLIETTFSDAALSEYRIMPDGSLAIHEKKLTDFLESAKQRFMEEIESERKRREDAEKQRAERLRQQQLEAERWREEQEKRRAEEEEKRKFEEARRVEEERRREEDFRRNLEEGLNQQETQVKDAQGNRWIKCEFCGKIAKETEFSSYGGAIGIHLNLGTCKECTTNNPAAKPSCRSLDSVPKKVYDPTICPECGSKLIERNGKNGKFIGCSGFPKCKYTRSIRNL